MQRLKAISKTDINCRITSLMKSLNLLSITLNIVMVIALR